jgi:hypothetical protein
MQFIYPRPPVAMIGNGKLHLLRRGEQGADLVRLDEIPAHLRGGKRDHRVVRNGQRR